MANLPYLPLAVEAWQADTAHLSDAENGRYWRLVCLMWLTPRCRVPDDDLWLARKLRIDAGAIVERYRPLIAEFCQLPGDGFVYSKRLTRERAYIARTQKRTHLRKPLAHNK